MKKNNILSSFLKGTLLKISLLIIGIIVLVFIVRLVVKDNHFSFSQNGNTLITPAQIESIKNIGQWEFLSVSDEELVDTIRHGFFGDDELMNIYYGTIRLGIDMKDTEKNWISRDHDTLTCLLPPIRLLDNEFIDEARTKTFFESGHWNADDHDALYNRAVHLMKKQCLTPDNLASARLNASDRFYNLFKSMGIPFVKIKFADGPQGQRKN